MKAAVLNDYQTPLSIEEVQIDPPKAGEVKVRIAATGVCHSDYHVMKGEWKFGVPIILGHEAAGIVEEVGEGSPASSRATTPRCPSDPGAGAAASASSAAR